uniref:Uncharacterized protein n=1 Tax=Glossina pallidipes TaxID=7398 RepID=A0A1A9ZMT3_GLOPL
MALFDFCEAFDWNDEAGSEYKANNFKPSLRGLWGKYCFIIRSTLVECICWLKLCVIVEMNYESYFLKSIYRHRLLYMIEAILMSVGSNIWLALVLINDSRYSIHE